MKRLLFSFLIALAGLPVLAQKADLYEGFDIYGLDSKSEVRKCTFGIELNIGGEMGLGLRVQRNFSPYISWDILQLKYVYDVSGELRAYDDDDDIYYADNDVQAHKFTATTGLRAFSPSFGKKGKGKLYTALSIGYGLSARPEVSFINYNFGYNGWSDIKKSHFALDFSLGFQFKKCHIGYGLNYLAGDWGMTDHTFRLGIDL